jgi:hypothetical protein
MGHYLLQSKQVSRRRSTAKRICPGLCVVGVVLGTKTDFTGQAFTKALCEVNVRIP